MSPGAALSPRRATYCSFASPKESRQRKGDPGACVPSLRYGQPAVLAPSGVPLELASLRQSRALIRLKLRSSARSQGFWGRIRGQALHAVATIFIAARARFTWAAALKRLKKASPAAKSRPSRLGCSTWLRHSRTGNLPPDFLQLDLQACLVVRAGAQHHFLT
jgi:hypothetical protein